MHVQAQKIQSILANGVLARPLASLVRNEIVKFVEDHSPEVKLLQFRMLTIILGYYTVRKHGKHYLSLQLIAYGKRTWCSGTVRSVGCAENYRKPVGEHEDKEMWEPLALQKTMKKP